MTWFTKVNILFSRRTGKASGAATARLKLEPGGGSPNKYELGKPQAHWSGKVRDGRKRGEVKTIRAKKPPIEALYPELPARRPNKG